MAIVKLLVAGLWTSSVVASPWSRNQKRGDGGKKHHGHETTWGHDTTTDGSPAGYRSTSEVGGWGYGSTSVCSAGTVTETLQGSTSTIYVTKEGSVTTLPASTVYVTRPGGETTITAPGRTETSVSTLSVSGLCSSAAPVTECETTVTQMGYLTRTLPGSNFTATETSVVTATGTTATEFR